MPRTPLLVGSLAIVIAACGESAWLRRCLRLPAGPRIASLDEGAVRLESVPESCAEGTSAVEAAPKDLLAGEEPTFSFGACAWAVTFSTTAEGPRALELRLRPG